MIEVRNICKSIEGRYIIEGIDGIFEQGKANLIIGSSGTGKTVLLKCIVGLMVPDQGEVIYDGRNFHKADRDVKTDIRREIGMLFQGGALFDSKSVEENVKFPLDMLTQMTKEDKLERVNFVLKRVGLENVNRLMPSEISGGMKKRVGIARALVNQSRYLFCDEPNSGLDPQTAIRIDRLIEEITEEYNITTIVVTHDMNSVMQIGDHLMFMYKGRKLWEGSNKDILNATVKELQDFIYANSLVVAMKEMHDKNNSQP
jgi:phospholipid/cholesterol/gamma-HCH transport system ATP-binding protein